MDGRLAGTYRRQWKPSELYHLQDSPALFSELRRRLVGISEKVFIQQLRDHVSMNIVARCIKSLYQR
ncbi:winged helix-turn-helix transcriptional regulator [Agrobacterium tumefaciens]|uniref:winged helix-turn-helix transcriptional regulator n=1 Tax=Agrobacterium tumefaciens TaxID=358 RepID=UPI003AF3B0FE